MFQVYWTDNQDSIIMAAGIDGFGESIFRKLPNGKYASNYMVIRVVETSIVSQLMSEEPCLNLIYVFSLFTLMNGVFKTYDFDFCFLKASR